jgi:hypothetical protein
MAPMGWTLFRSLSVYISIGSRFPRALHLQINGHTILASAKQNLITCYFFMMLFSLHYIF